MSIKTGLDFVKADRRLIRKVMTVVGGRLQDELNQINCLDLDKMQAKKNIGSSKSFG